MDINSLIAAGPHTQGIDVRGNELAISRIRNNEKRNELLDIGIANAPAQEARLQAQENREQKGFETIEGLRQGISLMRFMPDGEEYDIQGAIDYVSQGGVTEKEQPVIDMLQSGDPAQIEALRTGTKGLIETALLIGDIKQPAAAPKRERTKGADGYEYYVDDGSRVLPNVQAGAIEQFRAATPEELAALGPNVTGAQVDSKGKLVNIQKETGPLVVNELGSKADDLRQKYTIEANQEYVTAGRNAQKSLVNYQRGLDLIGSVETGAFAKAKNEFKKMALAAGFDANVDEIATFEELAPIFGKFLFEGIQQTKGSVSDKEMEVFAAINANYGFTTEGNRRLLEFGKQKAEREIELAKIVKRMRIEGKSAYEVQTAVDDYISNNEIGAGLVGEPARTDIVTVTTQEEYDALPSGAFFMEDGERYRKP